jgi:hypothetical protein
MRLSVLIVLAIAGCARSAPHTHELANASPAEPSAYGGEVVDGYARVRAATAAYRALDSAVAKGYAANVPQCLADSTHGAMGHHHVNRGYVDNRIEIDKPEILLYERGGWFLRIERRRVHHPLSCVAEGLGAAETDGARHVQERATAALVHAHVGLDA